MKKIESLNAVKILLGLFESALTYMVTPGTYQRSVSHQKAILAHRSIVYFKTEVVKVVFNQSRTP